MEIRDDALIGSLINTLHPLLVFVAKRNAIARLAAIEDDISLFERQLFDRHVDRNAVVVGHGANKLMIITIARLTAPPGPGADGPAFQRQFGLR